MKNRYFLSLVLLPLIFASNPIKQIHADSPPYQVTNGGFETGDLTGWKPYTIWKGESGIAAWQDARVVSDTYFGSNPYNRDGAYNLGVVWSGASWDQSSERMGHLRSSNFTLGGSGWISFKLGGGLTSSLAYVSFRRRADNVEIARFGNPMYNKTAFATHIYSSSITNAEAFMFPYYFDMTTVATLGTELYITLSDTSSYDWCILSADSFVTYYADAPVIPNLPDPNTDGGTYLADNIVPSIQGVDTASNTIANGNFDSGLTSWDNPDNAWQIDSGIAKSNATGDSNLGIIRSSAFITTTLKYVQFGWGGGLKHDKQIFVSVKEVGTNNEILRYVRRSSSSNYEDNPLVTHLLDLSSLNPNNKYYLEFADNKSITWGVSFIDNIQLVAASVWTENPTEQAIEISDVAFSTAASESFSAYFLDVTGPYCEAENGISIPWEDLSDIYAIERATTKDYIVSEAADEYLILAARDRYLFLINAYAAFGEDPFLKSAAGTPFSGSFDPIYPITVPENNTSSAIFVIATLSISLIGATLYIYTRKQR